VPSWPIPHTRTPSCSTTQRRIECAGGSPCLVLSADSLVNDRLGWSMFGETTDNERLQ
jgi:hypothetical protein